MGRNKNFWNKDLPGKQLKEQLFRYPVNFDVWSENVDYFLTYVWVFLNRICYNFQLSYVHEWLLENI
jgi:hypothetical protein